MARATEAGTLLIIEAHGKLHRTKELCRAADISCRVVATMGRIFDWHGKATSDPQVLNGRGMEALRPETVSLLRAEGARASTIVLATDPDPEGDLIALQAIEAIGATTAVVLRAKLYELTPQGLSKAFSDAQPFDPQSALPAAARRSFNRMIGMHRPNANARSPVSAVITPCLQEIEKGRQIVGRIHFSQTTNEGDSAEITLPVRKGQMDSANELLDHAVWGGISLISEGERTVSKRLPGLNLAELLVACPIDTGLEPSHVYECAQALYEDGRVSYIRTTSTEGGGGERESTQLASFAQALGLTLKFPTSVAVNQAHAHPSIGLIEPRADDPLLTKDTEKAQVYQWIADRILMTAVDWRAQVKDYRISDTKDGIRTKGLICDLLGREPDKEVFLQATEIAYGNERRRYVPNLFSQSIRPTLVHQGAGRAVQTLRLSVEAMAIHLQIEHGLGTPATWIRHAKKLSGLCTEDGRALRPSGIAALAEGRSASPLLTMPTECRKAYNTIMAAGGGSIEERVKTAITALNVATFTIPAIATPSVAPDRRSPESSRGPEQN